MAKISLAISCCLLAFIYIKIEQCESIYIPDDIYNKFTTTATTTERIPFRRRPLRRRPFMKGQYVRPPFHHRPQGGPRRFFRPRFQQRKKPLCTKSLSSFVKNWKWVGPIYTDREALTFPTIKVNEYPQYSHTLIDATDSPWSRSIKVRDAPPRDFVSFTATTSITLSTEAAKTPVDPYELSPFYES